LLLAKLPSNKEGVLSANKVDEVLGSVLGLYLPQIDQIRANRAELAIFEASLSSLGSPLGEELLRLRLWEFVTLLGRDAMAMSKRSAECDIDQLTDLQRRVIDWGWRHIVSGDRTMQAAVAILMRGTQLLDDDELYDLPDEMAELLSQNKQERRAAIRKGYGVALDRQYRIKTKQPAVEPRFAAE
jgi:hypothetical protein